MNCKKIGEVEDVDLPLLGGTREILKSIIVVWYEVHILLEHGQPTMYFLRESVCTRPYVLVGMYVHRVVQYFGVFPSISFNVPSVCSVRKNAFARLRLERTRIGR